MLRTKGELSAVGVAEGNVSLASCVRLQDGRSQPEPSPGAALKWSPLNAEMLQSSKLL